MQLNVVACAMHSAFLTSPARRTFVQYATCNMSAVDNVSICFESIAALNNGTFKRTIVMSRMSGNEQHTHTHYIIHTYIHVYVPLYVCFIKK